jgi:hypothetical protein
MKRTLSILALFLFTLVCQADGYFRGAWYCTKAPSLPQKYSGAFRVEFYNDMTADIHIYVGAELFDVVTVNYTQVATVRSVKWVFTFADADGWTYTGSYDFKKDILTGTFKSPQLFWKGKFQAVFVEYPDAAADAKTETAEKRTDKGGATAHKGSRLSR